MNVATYLGFDVGTKRTGVAIANSLTSQARGAHTIQHKRDGATNWGTVDELFSLYKIDLCVVGLAFKEDGSQQEITFIARSFGKKLAQRFNVEVVFVDEYLSSNEAKKQLKYNHDHVNAKRAEVDKMSAQLILQTWLNER